jgi:hypothetical protein
MDRQPKGANPDEGNEAREHDKKDGQDQPSEHDASIERRGRRLIRPFRKVAGSAGAQRITGLGGRETGVPTLHPAFVLRLLTTRSSVLVQDLKHARRLALGKSPAVADDMAEPAGPLASGRAAQRI